MVTADHWDPQQYNRFHNQRMQPFFDLVGLVQPRPRMRVVDLGCGTGELTEMLAARFEAATIDGIDTSSAMLEQAAARTGPGLSFERRDIDAIEDYSIYDLVFSHAALQWVPDNEALMRRLLRTLKPGAQVAVQVPTNDAHPSHRIAGELAAERPFRDLLGGYVRHSEVLPMERYAELLYEHGLREQVCFEKIYGHELDRSADVVEWVKGTSLNAYLSRLDRPDAERFLAIYRERLLSEIGDRSPYFYPFRRLLFWGHRSE